MADFTKILAPSVNTYQNIIILILILNYLIFFILEGIFKTVFRSSNEIGISCWSAVIHFFCLLAKDKMVYCLTYERKV